MRTLTPLLFLLAACVSSPAQTNTITFTNQSGVVISNAEAVKISDNKLLYRIPSGGGIVMLSNTPPDIQRKFNYNPAKAAQADEVDKQKHEAQLRQDQQAAAAASLAEYRRRIASSSMMVEGEVLQKLDAGLLVDSATEAKRRQREWDESVGHYSAGGEVKYVDQTTHLQLYNGLCLLTDYPRTSSIVDGDVVRAVAYPNGEYSYTAVSGGSKTVRQFTCDINQVVRVPSPAEQNQMKAWKPDKPF